MRHGDRNLTLQSWTSRIDVRPACDRRAVVRFFIFPTGWYGYEIENHMGKNNGNPDLVREKKRSSPVVLAPLQV